MSIFIEGSCGMGKRDERSGLEAFVRAHQTSGSVGEAAEKLGIDEVKYKKRFSVYNHRLKKNGYEPMVRHSGKITRTDAALAQLEKEGLLKRATAPQSAYERSINQALKGSKGEDTGGEQAHLWEND
jgi:hypothetical protein|tara:strand:+ start:326 stop:706 length:381 start_codon:yes stop_codon:yes gene_type:complete